MTVAGTGRPAGPNRLGPLAFVLVFGLVSGLGDVVYEGARSITGPFLATFGASAALVGVVTGLGEAVALVLRLATGRLSDRTGRHWALSITGYAITMAAVPLLALAGPLWLVGALIIAERFGKAVRSPARDTMLAEASVDMGRGRTFAVHEALDQAGALVGPLLVALALADGAGYRTAFALLAGPGLLAMLVLGWLRRQVPEPAAYGPAVDSRRTGPVTVHGFSRLYWQYSAFTAATMTGFATFALLAYHLERRDVVPAAQIPLLYAVAMGVAALASLGSGELYDRVGLRGLVVLPLFGAVLPFLSFSTSTVLVWIGAALWGALMGVHESTMRAAVADLVPPERRGAGYGAFTAVYGVAWLVGSAAIGVLYDRSITAAAALIVAAQAVALTVLVPVLRTPRSASSRSA